MHVCLFMHVCTFSNLCRELRLGAVVACEAWTTVLKVLVDHRPMLANQHLDRILLCALYSVCKVCLCGQSP
jgi:hypothetical protein